MKEENLRKRYLTYSIPKLKRIADEVFSLYIRNRDSKNGYNKCFTCDKELPIKELDAGHYISRINSNLRYFEKNVHVQCRYCNRYKEGMKDEYALRLIDKYGVGILEELNRWKKVSTTQWKRQDLIDIIFKYK